MTLITAVAQAFLPVPEVSAIRPTGMCGSAALFCGKALPFRARP
jgi:hypothetical protein